MVETVLEILQLIASIILTTVGYQDKDEQGKRTRKGTIIFIAGLILLLSFIIRGVPDFIAGWNAGVR